jgi:aconitate hydratase 2/2-methylisocitrate dehydratase
MSNKVKVEFKAPLVVAPPQYVDDEKKRRLGNFTKYSGFEFDDNVPKAVARTSYEKCCI